MEFFGQSNGILSSQIFDKDLPVLHQARISFLNERFRRPIDVTCYRPGMLLYPGSPGPLQLPRPLSACASRSLDEPISNLFLLHGIKVLLYAKRSIRLRAATD